MTEPLEYEGDAIDWYAVTMPRGERSNQITIDSLNIGRNKDYLLDDINIDVYPDDTDTTWGATIPVVYGREKRIPINPLRCETIRFKIFGTVQTMDDAHPIIEEFSYTYRTVPKRME